jgi:N-methylhydantoinase A
MTQWMIGVDIGGTFTDFILYDATTRAVFVHKVRSTPDDPARAFASGLIELCDLAQVAPSEIGAISHGTTVATNAVLEHRGAATAMITTRGFRDVVHIGRHQRPLHYSIQQDIPWQSRPFVERRHRLVVGERIDARGAVLEPLDEDEVRRAAQALGEAGVESVAVCFLFSYLNPEHERRAAQIVAEELPGCFVTTSSDITPQFREFERFTTACMNAFVGPVTGRYLGSLSDTLSDATVRASLSIMTSNGGVASPRTASEKPVTLMMSGPAAGVLGGAWAGALAGRDSLITFDVGGTSADIAIVTEGGTPQASSRDTSIGGYPLMVPMLDIHTIGAGGGSIAHVDDVGSFRVGPRSAGAEPGPACYGRGGTEATVTDANVVLGRIAPDRFLGGTITLDDAAAAAAVERIAGRLSIAVADAAEGIVSIINASMAQAIRSRTIERGLDPRVFALVAFGGAGPLHAAEVADVLGIPEVIVPPNPGITSAMGLLTSDLRYDRMQTVFALADEADHAALLADLAELETALRAQVDADGADGAGASVVRALDCRYVGQGYELRLEIPEATLTAGDVARFHELHRQEYGYAFDDPVEIVNLRVTVLAQRPKLDRLPATSGSLSDATLDVGSCAFRTNGSVEMLSTRFLERRLLPLDEPIPGPSVIFQRDSTVLVPPAWTTTALESGVLVLSSTRAKERTA